MRADTLCYSACLVVGVGGVDKTSYRVYTIKQEVREGIRESNLNHPLGVIIMLKLWKANALMFSLQIVFGVAGYYRLSNGMEISAPVIIAGSIMLFVFSIIEDKMSGCFLNGAFTAAICFFVIAGLESPRIGFMPSILLAVPIGLAALIAADEEQQHGAKEPFWLLFVTTLPGIGTIVGGVILLLLYRRLQKQQLSTA